MEGMGYIRITHPFFRLRSNSMIIQDTKEIISFLENRSQDFKGRTFHDMINCSDVQMEKAHDQIQWMFPLHEESNHAPQSYPILTTASTTEAKESQFVKNNLKIAKDRMERFYSIGEYDDIDKQRLWCRERNHNLLRITRIIRCLRHFDLEDEAKDFYSKIDTVGSHFGISGVTKAYWWRAMNEDVWQTLK